ncbi:hypothetical protein HMN09_00350500 [Mycena chlorophos]|uniref:Uncharacterized protein n=1 Tax=Mycena chlorophos TaxID=658473 RepID=A0A8H6TIM7_MYCCL|nr:hypothetical protein HMN09_00350500 [Mycena chlorophos]
MQMFGSSTQATGLDPRLTANPGFVLFPIAINDLVADWIDGATGGEDFWDRADAFIAKRHARILDEQTFTLTLERPARD